MSSEPQIRYTTTEDGVSIAFSTVGAGPVAIMLPSVHLFAGRMRVHHAQRELVNVLAAHFTVVMYDGRGMGLSSRGDQRYDIDAKTQDLEAVIAVVAGAEAVALYGQGFGGLTAMAFAARRPERVAALVVEDSFSTGEKFYRVNPTGRVLDALGVVTKEQWTTVSDLIGLRSQFLPAGDLNYGLEIGALLRETWTADEFMAHRLAVRQIDVQAQLAAIAVPTLIVFGGGFSFSVLELSQELASKIPGAQLLRPTASFEGWQDADYRALTTFLQEHMQQPPHPPESGTTGAEPKAGTAVILFTDIVDSTALTERLGDAAFRSASRSLDEAVRMTIREAGGTPVEGKVLGDGVMGVFTSAAEAITAARMCVELGRDLPMHIGLHAGDVTHEAGNVYGGAVNIASRICGLSAPGEILVSDVVRGMARSSAGVVFEDRGEQEMKGVGEPVRVYAVQVQP